MHYSRWRAHGDPTYQRPTFADRFWAKVDKQGPPPTYRPELGPCWVWTGTKDQNGYGQIGRGARGDGSVRAAGTAYELLVGPIPEGLEPDHLCRVPACVKPIADEQGPAHIEPVTHSVNMLRAWEAKRERLSGT
jgi:hypothetical protein